MASARHLELILSLQAAMGTSDGRIVRNHSQVVEVAEQQLKAWVGMIACCSRRAQLQVQQNMQLD